MQYTQLGNSDLNVSRVVLGTWALGGFMWGGTEANDPENAIRAGIDAGSTTIDTAPIYGFGLSEELVGKAIRGRREEVVIATKFGLRWENDEGRQLCQAGELLGKEKVNIRRSARRESILHECDRSLLRLGIDVIDLYQCHWPDPETDEEEIMEAMLSLQDRGKIRWFGVSNFDVPMMEACLESAPLTSLQPPYSLMRRSIEQDTLPFCREHNIGVIVYSPMFRGLLTGKITEDYEFSAGDTRAGNPWYNGENLGQVNDTLETVVRPIVERHDATLAQIAVAWCLAQPGVTAALVGARNAGQATANAAAGDIRLEPDEANTVGAAFADMTGGS